jgi:hypothetical protein
LQSDLTALDFPVEYLVALPTASSADGPPVAQATHRLAPAPDERTDEQTRTVAP